MSIIGIQRRLHEAGRIRIGAQVPAKTKDGREVTRPAKLETFRFTSRNEAAVKMAAKVYGGTPRKWDGGQGDQWEVITTTKSLPVLVPPEAMGFSQWMELWSGGGCLRRCNGERQVPSDTPCVCDFDAEPLEDAREERKRQMNLCKPHTRLSVMLAGLTGSGLWRLDTQGHYAAAELAGAYELARMISLASGKSLIPATLRLEQREVKRPDQPRRDFVVPVLDFNVDLVALATPETPTQITAGVTPIDHAPPQPLARQLEAVNDNTTRSTRSNAAAPLPATGMRPRPISTAEPTGTDNPGDDAGAVLPEGHIGSPPGTDPPASGSQDSAPIITTDQRRLLFASGRGQGLSETGIRKVVEQVTGQTSTRGMTRVQLDAVLDALPGAAQTAAVADDPSLTDWRAEV